LEDNVGFECVYHYHERVDGEYNKEETKTFKKKVGDPLDDVPLEKLAAAIMAQLARRDIWIVDVDVFEISKKEINFKEAKGGIVLKNKKFLFDGKVSDIITVVEEHPQQPQYSVAPYQAPPHQQQQSLSAAATPVQPHNMIQRPQRRAVDVVVYSPEPQQMFEAQKRGLKLTVDKRYEVFEKRPAPTGVGEIFIIQDDAGRDQSVSDAYFVPGNINLFGDKELGFSESQKNRESSNLLYSGNASGDQMPNLRGKR
jgi:hypothetical protein